MRRTAAVRKKNEVEPKPKHAKRATVKVNMNTSKTATARTVSAPRAGHSPPTSKRARKDDTRKGIENDDEEDDEDPVADSDDDDVDAAQCRSVVPPPVHPPTQASISRKSGGGGGGGNIAMTADARASLSPDVKRGGNKVVSRRRVVMDSDSEEAPEELSESEVSEIAIHASEDRSHSGDGDEY